MVSTQTGLAIAQVLWSYSGLEMCHRIEGLHGNRNQNVYFGMYLNLSVLPAQTRENKFYSKSRPFQSFDTMPLAGNDEKNCSIVV